MSELGLRQAQDKMVAAGISQQAIDVFSHYYHQLEDGITGFIAEDSIVPLRAEAARVASVLTILDAAEILFCGCFL